MNSFCAMNSLRMSFWIVPESVAQSVPALLRDDEIHREQHRRRPVDRHRRRHGAEVDVGKERFHVGERRDVDAALPHFAARQLVVGVATHQRRQVEGDAQTRAAGRQQTTIALVGLFRRPEARQTGASSRACRGSRWRECRACTESPRGRPDRVRSRALRCSAGCRERRGARIDYIVGVSLGLRSTVHGPQSARGARPRTGD